jgi:hypothetical protein
MLNLDPQECQRTLRHPLHTISTGLTPLPIEQWPPLQDPKDKPSNMIRVPNEEMEKIRLMISSYFVTAMDGSAYWYPNANALPYLTQTEHETMLHVKGPRVLHELSRSYFWPKMAEEMKQFCTACNVYQNSQIQRQNLSSAFRQAEEKDMPLPRQAYGIDFYGHKKGGILVAVDLCTREATLWFSPNRKQENVARALVTGLILQKEGCPTYVPQ